MVGENEFMAGSAPGRVAERLRQARLAAHLSLEDIATRTRVSVRHLTAIEEGRFGDLASRTYAVGFARAYARVVGLPEQEIASAVRAETDHLDESERPRPIAFEPGDPARVPGRGFAWAGVVAAFVLVGVCFAIWRTFLAPAIPLSELVNEPAPSASATVASAARAVPIATAPAGGAVVFTATAPAIWVKFYDASGKQLMQKQLAQGESYTVPANAIGPKLWTGRPDALTVTIGGKPVAPIGSKPGKVKDVPVDAASLLARPASAAPISAATAPHASPVPGPVRGPVSLQPAGPLTAPT
jgi:cytoskeleton protein RodZ